ncbi:MAG: hypothetical protein HYS27_09725 [Deltaproteobacteria bacterium]|nr:hypothetical protein [Deltaproteobacteria bacterium]
MNDWAMKRLLVGPGWLRGKLSDVAGLALCGILACACARALATGRRSRHALVPMWTLAAAGAFVAVKTSAASALALAAWWPWPSAWGRPVIVSDPTDLVALPALALGVVLGERMWGARSGLGRWGMGDVGNDRERRCE